MILEHSIPGLRLHVMYRPQEHRDVRAACREAGISGPSSSAGALLLRLIEEVRLSVVPRYIG